MKKEEKKEKRRRNISLEITDYGQHCKLII